MKKVLVLYTVIHTKKSYIKEVLTTREYDSKKLVDHTALEAEAMTFDTPKEADRFKDKLVNPFDRKYTMVYIKVEAGRKIKEASEVLA